MSTVRRIAVIGAGPMGQLHARAILRRAETCGDVELAWTIDHRLERSEAVAEACGGFAGTELEKALPGLDAAVVAVPTAAHVEVAERLLDAGVDVMVEKPMAGNVLAARALADRARSLGRVLVVGHAEWFNTELERARSAVSEGCEVFVVRAMPRSVRGLDIDVVQDLMLHDLDWLARIHGGEVQLLSASGTKAPPLVGSEPQLDGARRFDPAYVDEAEVALSLPGGGRAWLRASRCAAGRERSVRVEREGASLHFDLLASRADASEGGAVKVGPEPLDRAWADFLAACDGNGAPENRAEVGVASIELVERVQRALRRGDVD
jgi:predicted dehydrogenase